MSKKLKNYPDLLATVNKYGADAIRFYLISSPGVRAQDVAFFEKGVDEVMKKIIMRLYNVVSFYEMYEDRSKPDSFSTGQRSQAQAGKDVLDRWIKARLDEVTAEMTQALDAYELDRACRPIELFIDDLSTWYLRRSRERVKSDDMSVRTEALSALRAIVRDFAIILAPFMPFAAEEVFGRVKYSRDAESVHLMSLPVVRSLSADERNVLTAMKEVRAVVSLGLEARSAAKIKVRQPLASLTVRDSGLVADAAMSTLIKDEVNVKEIIADPALAEAIKLDTALTPALKEEGQMRELVRAVQEARKSAKMMPQDTVILCLDTDTVGRALANKYLGEISRIAGVASIEFKKVDREKIDANGVPFGIEVRR